MFKNITLGVCLVLILSGCFGGEKVEKWTAFIHPDKNDIKKNIKSPITFSTLEECKKISTFFRPCKFSKCTSANLYP